jgi:MFS family permease
MFLGAGKWRLHATRRPSSASPAHQLHTILAAVDITLVHLPALGAERGIEASAIGLLTIRGVASMTSRLFLGQLTALIGRRKLLITGTLVAAVALAGASLPVSVAVITILMSLTVSDSASDSPSPCPGSPPPRPPVHAVVQCHCGWWATGPARLCCPRSYHPMLIIRVIQAQSQSRCLKSRYRPPDSTTSSRVEVTTPEGRPNPG